MTPDKEPNKGGSRLQKPGGQAPAPRKPRLTSRQKVLRVVYVLVTVLALLVVAVFAASRLLFVKPTVPTTPDIPNLPAVSGSPEGLDGETPSVYGSGRKEDFFTFLVIGRDTGGGGNTDTILLAAYDVPNQQLNVMSIPRDTMVNVSWDIKRINSVYNWYGGGEDGIEALDNEISQLVGFVPDFQVVVEWEAVGELVDALGGVWYDVPRDMYYWDPTQDLLIDVDPGYQLLDGDKAMQVVRFRDGPNGYSTGDLGRIETQQGFLKAVVEQCLQITNVTRIGDLARVFTDNVTTNLTIPNLLWFAQQAVLGNDSGQTLDMDSVNFVTMPCTARNVWSRSYAGTSAQYQSYVVPNTRELVDLVNECFNPYLEDLGSRELDIMYVNSDGTIGSSTGVLEDRTHNTAWLEYRNRPQETEEPSESPLPAETEDPKASPDPEASPDPDESPDPDASSSPNISPSPDIFPSPGISTSPGGTESPAPGPDTPPTGGEALQTPPPAESPQTSPAQTPIIDPDLPLLTPPPAAITTPTPDAGSQDSPPEGIPLL